MHFVFFRGTILSLLTFLQIKDGGRTFRGEPILQNWWIIWSLIVYFSFKHFMDPNRSSFIKIPCILHDSEVLFSEFLKRTNFAIVFSPEIVQNHWIVWSPIVYFNFKSFKDPNSPSWSFIRFQCILQDSGVLFSEFWYFYILKRGNKFLAGTNSAESLSYLLSPSVLQF